jgi:iron complex transport system substrate-binding protein
MKNKWLISTFLLTIGLAGCGQEMESNEAAEDTIDAAETQVVTDGIGQEVEIPANPERILASYLEDYLVALEVSPIAQWSVHDGASIQTYLQDELDGLPLVPHDLPFESVLELEPDFMIVRDPIEEAMHEQYSQITPTYVLNSSPTEWRETLEEIGSILNREEQAEAVIDEYEEKVSQYADELEAEVAGESAAAIWMIDTSLFVVHENRSSGAVLYEDLGLEVPSVVSELSSDADWAAISLEELAQMDVDHLFLVNSDGADADLFEDRLWQNIPAVQEGQVYEFGPDTAWLYYGPIASEQIVDHVVESILE